VTGVTNSSVHLTAESAKLGGTRSRISSSIFSVVFDRGTMASHLHENARKEVAPASGFAEKRLGMLAVEGEEVTVWMKKRPSDRLATSW